MKQIAIAVGMLVMLFSSVGANQQISGRILYTAELASDDPLAVVGSNDLLLSNTVGADPTAGRTFIGGDETISVAGLRAADSVPIVLAQAYLNAADINHNLETAFIAAANVDGSGLARLTTREQGSAQGPDWSPDLSQVVFSLATEDTNGDGRISRLDNTQLALLDVGRLRRNPLARQLRSQKAPIVLTDADFSVQSPQFIAPNLVMFDSITDEGLQAVYVYNVLTRELAPLPEAPGQTARPSASPDGRQIAVEVYPEEGSSYVARYDRVLNQWERLSPEGVVASAPHWMGDRVAMITTDPDLSQVYVWEAGMGTIIAKQPTPIVGVRLSPDARAAAYAYIHPQTENRVLRVVTLDLGYDADFSPLESNVLDFVWDTSF